MNLIACTVTTPEIPLETHFHELPASGPIRNGEMAKYADALIAMWDGTSTGTKNMIDQATKHGLKVYVVRY